jgi:type IV pilus assembly protein PilM
MARGGSKRSVGLEIDTGAVRAVEASGAASSPRLINMAEVSLPSGVVEEGMVLQPLEVGYALEELWSKGRIKHRKVLLGVSNQGVLVRYSTIPKVPKEKLAAVIRFHAQELLPIPLESVVMDYMVIGETKNEEGTDMLQVLLVAARRDMLNGFISALTAAKLEPADIDVSTLALMHILPQAAYNRTVAVVNINNGLSNILVSSNLTPRLARLVAVKVKDLAERLEVPLGKVISESDQVTDVRQELYFSWMKTLINETRSSLNYYQNQSGSSDIEAIMLNGRGARLGNLAANMQKALELPVKIVNPFAGYVNAGMKSADTGIRAVDYAVCAGLARRGLEG